MLRGTLTIDRHAFGRAGGNHDGRLRLYEALATSEKMSRLDTEK